MIDVRGELPSDEAAIRIVVRAAFPTSAEADLVDALRAAGDVAVSAVVIDGDAVVGHALLSKMSGPFPIVGLGPVAVLPERQNQGLGARVVTHALDLERKQDWAAAFVLGNPAYYARFGFSLDLAHEFTSPFAGPNFMVLPLKGVLPTHLGKVDYAPAFMQPG